MHLNARTGAAIDIPITLSRDLARRQFLPSLCPVLSLRLSPGKKSASGPLLFVKLPFVNEASNMKKHVLWPNRFSTPRAALWAVVTSIVAVGLAPHPRAAEPIRWSVVNNFGLLSGADAQRRFKLESDAYIACMAKRFSPGQCDNGRETFGLTRQPYPVRFESRTLKYDAALLHPIQSDNDGAADHVSISLSLAGAVARSRCDWTIGDKSVRNASCQQARASVPLEQDIAVKVEVLGKTSREEVTTVRVRRVVIATLGDSFMSGEGNPHTRSKVQPVKSEGWLEPRCHRSLLTSSALAAFRWADANPQAYVAYFNFACSGSTAQIGLLGQYEGIISSRYLDNLRGEGEEAVHFRGKTMPSQIDQAREALCAKGQCIAPDVVFLSIGINMLGFSTVITELSKPTCDNKCLQRLRADLATKFTDLTGDGAEALKTAYETVATGLAPKTAFAIEYPDPTRDQNGKFCAGNVLFPVLSKLGVGRVDASENKWAYENVLEPLNKKIVEIAGAAPGWQVIRGAVDLTKRNGFCSTERFFNSGQDAKGTSGTMHPNAAGHNAIAQLLLARMTEVLKR